MSVPLDSGAGYLDYTLQFLPPDDQCAYSDLSVRFREFSQFKKRSGLHDFADQLTSVHDFICLSDARQSIRALVCGIFFGPRFILVNTYRLKDLLQRSKSGLNNCFQKLGYDVMRPSNEIIGLFEKLMPEIDLHAFQIKQWCLRIETEMCKFTYAPHVPLEIAMTFEQERIPIKLETQPPEVSEPAVCPLDIRFLLNRDPPDVYKKRLC
jgi:hypothetical protein